jgi:hypothetical protein
VTLISKVPVLAPGVLGFGEEVLDPLEPPQPASVKAASVANHEKRVAVPMRLLNVSM